MTTQNINENGRNGINIGGEYVQTTNGAKEAYKQFLFRRYYGMSTNGETLETADSKMKSLGFTENDLASITRETLPSVQDEIGKMLSMERASR